MNEYNKAEIERIRRAYTARDGDLYSSGWEKDIYHPRHPMGRLFLEHNQNILVDALNHLGINLEHSTILDVGCGEGGWLRYLVELGAIPTNLNGIDLSESRVEAAKRLNPAINLSTSEGDSIPFLSDVFDIVIQVVVFSSIIEQGLAQTLLTDMIRVTKPGGYLFWIDHKNSHSAILAGYSIELLTEWLPGCSLIYQESVHPRYFRNWYRYPWLCRFLYGFTRKSCDSWFLVLRKDT